ncbi:MAG: hypothetical protein WCA08_16495 [Desulfoferrobacter sp.]
MNNTHSTYKFISTCSLAAFWMALALMMAPMAARADKVPGYDKYKEGYEGYMGDGILKEGEDEDAELARAVQNPVADLISLPFQNNTNFNFGPLKRTQNVLNIQPVIPIDLTERWLMVTRTIVPVVSQPAFRPGQDREFGLSDTLFSAFFSPKDRNLWLGNWLWGAGPAILLPTSTDDRLGPGEWGAGPSAVFLTMRGRWVIGSLFSNVWSFTGDDSVNLFTWQPFVNYNLDHGWYLTSSPVITANWKADSSDNTWTVPIGGGFGRVFHLGRQPLNASLQGFCNVVKPDNIGPDWTIRFTIQFLFPKGRG